MSVVLAVRTKDGVYMGGDSQITYGESKSTLVSPNLYKVWNVDEHPNTIMGGVGALRDLNIASCMGELYDPISDKLEEELSFPKMVNEVVPGLFNHFTQHGRTLNDGGVISLRNSSFLIAQKDNCYLVDTDGCVMDLMEGECIAIGSGAVVAKAAYEALDMSSDYTTEQKIAMALVRSCEQSAGVGFPIYIMNTMDETMLYMSQEDFFTPYEDEDEDIEAVEDNIED